MGDPLAWLDGLSAPVVLVLGAVVITAEAALLIGVLLPGASALLAIGVLAYAGAVPLAPAMVTAASAAVAGTQVAYLRGRRGRLPSSARLSACTGHAVRLLADAGPWAVCAAQWLVGLRTVTPRLAARAGIGYRRFSTLSVPTAGCWGAALVTAGYLAGPAYRTVSHRLGIGTLVLLAVLVGVLWLRYRRPRSDPAIGDDRPAR